MADHAPARLRLRDVIAWAGPILGPDRGLFGLTLVYGVGISLLSLATPISVQMLINSVANTALPTPLFTLAAILFVLLTFAGVMSAMRIHVMELFRQRFFARQVAEISLRAIHASNPFFTDERKADLFNRYFEIVAVQKAVPSLLIGLFTILLQSAVGFVVTSLYHPIFLAFNLVFITTVWLIWQLGARGGMRSAIDLSHAKYDTAHWIGSIAASNGFYKSDRNIAFAIDRTDTLITRYTGAYRRHLRYWFTQTVAFMVLYALASAGLLALGGWLVIQGQLSIGQLVAAELILSSIFYGAAQLGPYLDSLYDLGAAVEELSLIYAVPQEMPARAPGIGSDGSDLAFRETRIGQLVIDLAMPAGARVVAHADTETQRKIVMLLKRHATPDCGFITLGGADISTIDPYRLRRDVTVIDRPTIVEGTIFDYLDLACPDDTPAQIMNAVRLTGLERRIGQLPDGMQTVLASTGWPLGPDDLIRLKLAAALLRRPRVLVLSPLFDMIPVDELDRILAAFDKTATSILYFTNRADLPSMTGFLWFGRETQQWVEDRTAFDAMRGQNRESGHAHAR